MKGFVWVEITCKKQKGQKFSKTILIWVLRHQKVIQTLKNEK